MASSEEEWGDDIGGGDHVADDSHSHTGQIEARDMRDEAHDNGDADAGGSGAERGASPEKSHGNGRDSKRNARKRGRRAAANHGDDDFESQPTITKWFRQVPGPLQDVMKQQHADLQQSMDDDGIVMSGRSSGHAVHISTVFDDGPWVAMCDYLGISTTPGELYGGIKMSSLKHTISFALEDDQSSPKIERLLVLIKSMRYIDEEIFAVFHDPTGEIEGYFHRDIVEQVGPALVKGTAVLLCDVSVFTPTDAAGTSKRYLNVIPRNVEAIFVPPLIATNMETLVGTFNEVQAEMIKIELEAAEKEAAEDDSQAPQQRVFAPADVRTATTELSFISQRQVVQRHQPVRPDPDDANGTNAGSATGKQKKKKAKDAPSGLGRWQWHQLAQKKPAAATVDAEEDTSREPRRHVPSGGRFTELLSQHIQARSRLAANSSDRSHMPAAASSQNTSTSESKTPAKAVRFSTIQESAHEIAQDDDDDDW